MTRGAADYNCRAGKGIITRARARATAMQRDSIIFAKTEIPKCDQADFRYSALLGI